MLITKEIEIVLNKGNIPLFKKKFPDKKIGDVIIIDIKDISTSSKFEVEVQCDFCFEKSIIKYIKYNRSLKNNDAYACSKKCSSLRLKNKLLTEYNVENISMVPYVKEKIKNNNLEKYGVENYFSSEESMEKIKNTNLKRYGVDNPQQNETIHNKTKNTNLKKYGSLEILSSKKIRDKIENTNLEKYGNKSASVNKNVKEKIINTNIEKYGFNSPLLNEEILNKSKKTLYKNYGVNNPLQSNIIKNKLKQTNLEKYGVEYVSQNEEIKEKIRKNNLEKYGAEVLAASELFRKENFIIAQHPNYIKYIKNKISLFKCDCDKDHYFELYSDNFYQRNKQNLPLCTICYPIDEQKSIKENEIFNFIKNIYKGKIMPGYRDTLEIDIYLPDLKLGFEFNGLYWHSDEYKENNYHLNKTLFFKEKNIRIIHIFEDDWNLKQNIIKSQIKNLIGLTENKIFARKCKVKEIKSSEFLEQNHIQGNVSSIIKLGLYFNDELVSIMTFDNFEGRKKMEKNSWNLSRFCNKINYNIIGGASKLFNYFIKNYNPLRIISYADRIWSEGNLYYKLGFNLISETKPDYKYIINNKRVHKSNFKKSKLNTILTESQEMLNKGINKIYDCGKLKFEIKIAAK